MRPRLPSSSTWIGVLTVALLVQATTACGYRAVYGAAGERFHVKVVRMAAVDAVACDEVASGVREELARAGAVEAGEGYPRVEIEVLRFVESSEGIADVSAQPEARGTDVAVRARAWIVRRAGGAEERDTGDVQASEIIAVDERAGSPDPRADVFHLPEARRAAARRVGHALAKRILGLPVVSVESGQSAEP